MSVAPFISSASTSREAHKSFIISLIYREREISRVELAHRCQLSRSAISHIVSELVHEGWVVESGAGPSIGGRRPALLRLNERTKYLLGVELGAHSMAVVLTDLLPRVLFRQEYPREASSSLEAAVAQSLRAALAQSGVEPAHLVGVGVGVPDEQFKASRKPAAPGDRLARGKTSPRESAAVSSLRRALRKPTVVEHSAKLAVLGEASYGAGRGFTCLAYVHLGVSLSGAVLRGGTVASLQEAARFAHRVEQADGPVCYCGQRGCVQAIASGEAIVQRVLAAIQAGQPTQLQGIAAWKGTLTLRDLGEAARMGDSLSRQILMEAGHSLGIAIAETASLLKLRRVVVGGELAQSDDGLVATLRKAARQRTDDAARFDIEPASLGRYSAALGAIVLLSQKLFAAPADEAVGAALYAFH